MPIRRTSPRRSATRPSVPLPPYEDEDEFESSGRLAAAAPWLAVGAAVIAIAALAITVFGRGADLDACRKDAWKSVPSVDDLPNGWTLNSTDLNANGMTVSIAGPAPADGSANAPTVYASVTCYGDVATTAMTQYKDAATAAGATVTDRSSGGAAYDVDNAATGSVTTLFRVGGLIGQVADAGSAAPADLAAITSAVANAMGDRAAAGTSGGAPNPSGPAGSGLLIEPSGSDAAGASASPAAPELEALLPKDVGGTTLTVQSATASDVLGTDPNSRALSAVVRSLGAQPADLQIAQAYDDTNTIDLSIIAFRLIHGDATKLKGAVISTWLSAGATGVKQTEVQLAGKTFTKVDYGDEGTIEYVYAGPDYVIVVDTADATIATEVASKLK